MKAIKKTLVILVLLASTLLLTSCKKNPNLKNREVQFLAINQKTETVVVEEFNFEQTEEKKINTKIWKVLHNGEVVDTNIDEAKSVKYFDANNNELTDTDVKDAVIKKYYIDVSGNNENIEVVLTQYIKQEDNTIVDIIADFVMLDKKGNATAVGSILRDSYVFTGDNIKYYAVRANGEFVELSAENVTYEGFPDSKDLIVNKKFVNYYNVKDVKSVVEFEGFEKEFNFDVRIISNYKPYSTKTATFSEWVFLQLPIAFLMSFVGKISGGSFAIAILVTTLIVRSLAWPIYAKSNDLSMKMSIAQPDIDRINRKYAGREDVESKQKMQLELMQVYKKHKINMFGCLLPFLQMPIFIAMFNVVRRITVPGGQFYKNVENTNFLFFTNFNTPQLWVKIIFTLLVGVTMFILQKVSSVKPSYAKNIPQSQKSEQAEQTEKTMKMVSYFMIIMMISTAYATPGLALSYYWIIGNIYAIGQTLINRKMNEKKYEKMQEEQLYGRSREIIEAELKKKGDK